MDGWMSTFRVGDVIDVSETTEWFASLARTAEIRSFEDDGIANVYAYCDDCQGPEWLEIPWWELTHASKEMS